MMAANSEATLKLKVAATTKQAEAEIPITGAGEGTAITSVEGSMDMAAAPCGDFYRYSCGKYVFVCFHLRVKLIMLYPGGSMTLRFLVTELHGRVHLERSAREI